MIPQVVASEQGRAQTLAACCQRVVGLHLESEQKPKYLERYAIEGDSPVGGKASGRAVS